MSTATIVMRVEISDQELEALRRRAESERRRVSTVAGIAIRAHLATELEGAAVQPAKDDAAAPSGG